MKEYRKIEIPDLHTWNSKTLKFTLAFYMWAQMPGV